MSKVEKYESNDPVYILGQIPIHILFALVFSLLFLGTKGEFNEITIFSMKNPFNWLIVGVFTIMIILDLINIISFFRKLVRFNGNTWEFMESTLYKEKSEYKLSSLDNIRTVGMILAFSSFFLIPELLSNHPIFNYHLSLVLVFIGSISGWVSIFLSWLVYNSSKMQDESITNSFLWWVPFLIVSAIGNLWAFNKYHSNLIDKADLLLLQLPLMSAFAIGLIGIWYETANNNPSVKKLNFLIWYIPLLILSLGFTFFMNLI